MKKVYTLSVLWVILGMGLQAQTDFDKVYNLFQAKCTSSGCHIGSSPAAGLNLVGSGATLSAQKSDVYNALVGVNPTNSAAVANHNKRVQAGDPYRSFLFRKINQGLAPNVDLSVAEGNSMPNGMAALNNKEKELIRQWILFGAKQTGALVDTSLIRKYYDGGGINSLTDLGPAPTPPSEGFQIHFGPFFLDKSSSSAVLNEIEYLLKYPMDFIEDSVEVTSIETFMGTHSHHFIVWRFDNASTAASKPNGLRTDIDFNKDFVTAAQESFNLQLPGNTAFIFRNSDILDLNSHYLNYSLDKVSACEVYINVKTQPIGTALQIMRSQIIPNFDIYIPNNGLPDVETDFFNYSVPINLYVWSLYSHTHKYGVDYDMYLRNSDGSRGTQIYEGKCPDAIPGCTGGSYDYQHPPTRYFYPLLGHRVDYGMIHEATYVNDGPEPKSWGFTADDEMMVTVLFYLLDTTGVTEAPNGIHVMNQMNEISIFPNPAANEFYIDMGNLDLSNVSLELYDVNAKLIKAIDVNNQSNSVLRVSTQGLENGMYFVKIMKNKQSDSFETKRLLIHP